MDKIKIMQKLRRADIPVAQALINSHKPQNVHIKSAVIQLLYWSDHLNQQQIASILNTSQSSISRLMHFHRKNINSNHNYTKTFTLLKNNYDYA